MERITFTIKGRFPSLNEYTASNRANIYKGSKLKKDAENQVIAGIIDAKLKRVTDYPISLNITWYEQNRRRDIDNIVYAVKFINDALITAKIIEDDSQKYVKSINNNVKVDRNNPRIEVEIITGKEQLSE